MNSVASQQAEGADFTDMRAAMVTSQLRTNAVDDGRVVAAMAVTHREAFVPVAVREVAYRDTPLPAGGGRWINPPLATGRLLTAADLAAGDRVLLIGAAGGYTAALLAGIVAAVTAVEQDRELLQLARSAVSGLGNVTVVEAPLTTGAPDGAPYDVLIIDGAVEAVPATLLDQLRIGARIAAGLVERGVTRLASGRKTSAGFGIVPFSDSDCVVLPGFAAPQAFRF